VREDSTGNLSATVDRASANGNTADGLEFDENGAGNLSALASRGSAWGNGGFGVRADEASDGNGTLTLRGIALLGNASGPHTSNVPVVQS
jgi:hypothetical protein